MEDSPELAKSKHGTFAMVMLMIAVFIVTIVIVYGIYWLTTGRQLAARAALQKGKSEVLARRYDAAVADLTRAIAYEPDLLPAYYYRGFAYHDQKEYSLSIKDLTNVIHGWSGCYLASPLDERAIDYLRLGDFKRALSDSTSAVQLTPGDARILYDRSTVFQGLDNPAAEIADLTKAILVAPTEPDYRLYRGRAYRLQKNYTLALADFTQAIRIKPKATQYYVERGYTYECVSKYDLAFKDFNCALQIEPVNQSARAYRARLYGWLRNYDGQIADLTTEITIAPQNAYYYDLRGYAYTADKKYDQAVSDFTLAIALKPKVESYYLGRANAYWLSNRPALAILDCTTAIGISPINSNAYNARGYYRLKQGLYSLAQADLQQALATRPGFDLPHFNLGVLYAITGDAKRSAGQFRLAVLDYGHYKNTWAEGDVREALKLHPNSPALKQALAILQAAYGQPALKPRQIS